MIMKLQQKEYEEIRNAELIEAQRLEAAELRRKQELDRRRVQQKARKEERKAAHQKYTARQFAKKYLVGMRENALKALKDQGMLVKPIEIVLEETVLPWLMEQMDEFQEDIDDQLVNRESVIREGFQSVTTIHARAVQSEFDRK